MAFPERSIFRESAIKKYLQRQEQSVLLRAVSPPAFTLLWIVLLLFLGAGVLAWSIELPVATSGQGIVVEQASTNEVVATLFFSPDQQGNLHAGQAVTVNIGSTDISLNGVVGSVETGVIGPDEARQRFNLQGVLAQVVTGPSVVVLVNIGPATSAHVYVGSTCAAQVRIGSQRVLSLLPGFGQIIK